MKKEDKNEENLRGLVTFTVGEEEFGLDLFAVQTIIRMMKPTQIPKSPVFVEGVINLRGFIIPVIDFRKRFDMPLKEPEKDTRIVVTDMGERMVGFIVDSVSEVLRIPTSIIEPPPPMVGGVDAEYIEGIGKMEDRLLVILNIEKLLSESEKKALKKVKQKNKGDQ